MKRGISPIVAVVLLIAIAVIAAVGLYFWVGGMATKQPTPEKPNVITAVVAGETEVVSGKYTPVVLVQNLGTTPITAKCLQTSEGALTAGAHTGIWCVFTAETTINPGQQAMCFLMKLKLDGGIFTQTSYNGTLAIYGPGTGSAIITLPGNDLVEYGGDLCV